MSKDIGIDLGTANTIVFLKGRDIVLREPSVVAQDAHTGKVLAVGDRAKKMIGRTPDSIRAIRPLKDGVIADFDVTAAMLKEFIKIVSKKYRTGRPRVIVCIPYGVTEVERRAVEESIVMAGGREAFLIQEPMAAAIGAGLPVSEAMGSMVVDIGGGTSEIAVISLGDIVTSKSIRIGGDKLDEAIISHVKRRYNLAIGARTAEEVKINIGSAYPFEGEGEIDVRGLDLVAGLPNTVRLTALEVREAIMEPVRLIVEGIKTTLENTLPELSADIIDHGIMLTGGGALLKGLDKLISDETGGISVKIPERPLDCVADGTGRVLDDLKDLSNVLLRKSRL